MNLYLCCKLGLVLVQSFGCFISGNELPVSRRRGSMVVPVPF